MQTIVQSAIAWVSLAICVLALARMQLDRMVMQTLYGRSRYESCQAVTALLGRQSGRVGLQRLGKWLVFAVGAVALAQHSQQPGQPWQELGDIWLPMVCLAAGCLQFFGQARPAVVLLLGNSSPATLRLHGKLMNELWPHRCVSLIETSDAWDSRRQAPGDVFRVTTGDWRTVVWRFARAALVIVVDVRTEITPPVKEELQFIMRERLQYKTVLLAREAQGYPDSGLAGCSLRVSESTCVDQIKRALAAHDTLPSDHQPLRAI